MVVTLPVTVVACAVWIAERLTDQYRQTEHIPSCDYNIQRQQGVRMA